MSVLNEQCVTSQNNKRQHGSGKHQAGTRAWRQTNKAGTDTSGNRLSDNELLRLMSVLGLSLPQQGN